RLPTPRGLIRPSSFLSSAVPPNHVAQPRWPPSDELGTVVPGLHGTLRAGGNPRGDMSHAGGGTPCSFATNVGARSGASGPRGRGALRLRLGSRLGPNSGPSLRSPQGGGAAGGSPLFRRLAIAIRASAARTTPGK